MPDSHPWADALVGTYPALGRAPVELGRRLHAAGTFVTVPAGAIIFEPENFVQVYPFLLAGTARVVKVGAGARDTLLYRLRPGEHCLLSSTGLLARWRFGARVVAESDVEAVVIPGDLFRSLVNDVPGFARAVHVAIARRLEVVLDLVEQATYFRLDQRVAAFLLAQGSGLKASHQELADDLGASRENVSRILESLAAKGFVGLGRRRIDILDATALERVLDDEG